MRKILLALPLLLVFLLVGFLFGMLHNSEEIPPSLDRRGQPFPEFRLQGVIEDRYFTSQDLPPTPTIVSIWASWCHWCLQEFAAFRQLKSQGVNVIGIALDEQADAAAALQKWGNPFTWVAFEPQNGVLAQTLAINSVPKLYLLDKNQRVRYQQINYTDDFINKLTPELNKLQQESK